MSDKFTSHLAIDPQEMEFLGRSDISRLSERFVRHDNLLNVHPGLFELGYLSPQLDNGDPDFPCELRGTYTNYWKPAWSAFGHPRGRTDGYRHSGSDIYAKFGSPIVASVAGDLRIKSENDGNSLGNRAWLSFKVDGDGWRLIYGHLSAFEGGDRFVDRGDVIGYAGCSGNADYDGRCTGDNDCGLRSSHVHLMLIRDRDGLKVDPVLHLDWTVRYSDDQRVVPCSELNFLLP